MGTTPLWVPLAVAGVAVIGTLAGVVFTQVWNSRLEERRWARETERLREAQAREDLYRTYEHRRAAYIDFQQEADRLLDLLHNYQESVPLDDAVFDELNSRLTPIRVYSTYEADHLALECLTDLQMWGREPGKNRLSDDAFSSAVRYRLQIRKDLGVPEWKPAESPEPKPATDQR